ncbi:hypothetical protein, partial [Xanthovirga aplysinae]|uniref:hypothetical protein n=1 Tax=Xanthovirga aplysinae TaxID=2529853 RepID=UPI001CA41BFE
MKKLYFSTGGRMLHLDDLKIMQEELYKAIEDQYKGLPPFIMSGCQVSLEDQGYKIQKGLIYLNGQFLEFEGASGLLSPNGYLKEAPPEGQKFYQLKNGGQAPKRILYKAEFVSGNPSQDFTEDYILLDENGGKTYYDVFPLTLQQLTDQGAITTNAITAGGGAFNGNLTVANGGKVGIGVPIPAHELEVAGNLKISGIGKFGNGGSLQLHANGVDNNQHSYLEYYGGDGARTGFIGYGDSTNS